MHTLCWNYFLFYDLEQKVWKLTFLFLIVGCFVDFHFEKIMLRLVLGYVWEITKCGDSKADFLVALDVWLVVTPPPTHTHPETHTTRICIQFTFRLVLSPAQLLTVCQTQACPWVIAIFCRLNLYYPLYLSFYLHFSFINPSLSLLYASFNFTLSLISLYLGLWLLSLLPLHLSSDWDVFFFFLYLTSHYSPPST